jgi:hypothetical protein
VPTVLPDKIVIHLRIPELNKAFSIQSQKGVQNILVQGNRLIITDYNDKFIIKIKVS